MFEENEGHFSVLVKREALGYVIHRVHGGEVAGGGMISLTSTAATPLLLQLSRAGARKLAHDLLNWCSTGASTDPRDESQIDERALACFAEAMSQKLAKKRGEGRGGWHDAGQCSPIDLAKLFYDHLKKGDPVDLANFCMMIHARPDAIGVIGDMFVNFVEDLEPSEKLLRAQEQLDMTLEQLREVNNSLAQAVVVKRELERDLQKAQEERRNAWAETRQLERKLARSLGYIDRVNETAPGSPHGPLIQGPDY